MLNIMLKKSFIEMRKGTFADEMARLNLRLSRLVVKPQQEAALAARNHVQDLDKQCDQLMQSYTEYVALIGDANTQANEAYQSRQYIHAKRAEIQAAKTKLEQIEDGLHTSTTQQRPGGTVASPSQTANTSCQHQQNPFKKLDPPRFTGKVQDFPRFRKLFGELTNGVGLTDTVLLQHLRSCLPKEALELIKDSDTTAEAWKALERLYGDRETAILTVLQRIHEFDNFKGEDHVRIERLAAEIQTSVKLLCNLSAEESLSHDHGFAAKLVRKLPMGLQWE